MGGLVTLMIPGRMCSRFLRPLVLSSATFKKCRFASSAAFVVALPPLRVLWRRRNDVFKNKSPEEACKEYRSSMSKEIPEEKISQKNVTKNEYPQAQALQRHLMLPRRPLPVYKNVLDVVQRVIIAGAAPVFVAHLHRYRCHAGTTLYCCSTVVLVLQWGSRFSTEVRLNGGARPVQSSTMSW